MNNSLKVETLDHKISISNIGNIKVGCQTISGEDALKIAEFIKSNEERLKPKIELGKWYMTNYGLRIFTRDSKEFFAYDEEGIRSIRNYSLEDLCNVYTNIKPVEQGMFTIDDLKKAWNRSDHRKRNDLTNSNISTMLAELIKLLKGEGDE